VALRMALDAPQRVGRLVLMGPGGIGISQGKPTDGLKRLLGYYAGEGPTLERLRAFIREGLVYDGSRVSDAVSRSRQAV
jgi:4,5:9,10-diseco-3-hydroxy-5,9,17-trioxoandrosta-1(10),2-diene-4-oate hydrolase